MILYAAQRAAADLSADTPHDNRYLTAEPLYLLFINYSDFITLPCRAVSIRLDGSPKKQKSKTKIENPWDHRHRYNISLNRRKLTCGWALVGSIQGGIVKEKTTNAWKRDNNLWQ